MKALKSKPALILTVLLVLAIGGCTKDPADSCYVPSASNVTANATLMELQQGRALFINNCGRCHNLYLPESYTPAQWKSILTNMAPRTSLTSAEIQLVTKYVCKGQQ